VYIGLAVTSHNSSTPCTATFDNVTLPGWANPLPPSAPTSVTATAWDSEVVLSWPASTGAISYNVKRATTAGGPYALVSNVGTTNFTDNGLLNGTSYYYVVSALDIAGESPNSAQAGATPVQLPQPAIAGISVAGGNLVFSGTNGLATGGFSIWSSTNLATPPAGWQQIGTGSFDGNGNFSVTNPMNAGAGGQYFMLRQP